MFLPKNGSKVSVDTCVMALTLAQRKNFIIQSRSDLHLRHQQWCNAETRAATEGRTGSVAVRRRSSTRRLSEVESQAHSPIPTSLASGLNPDRRSQCQSHTDNSEKQRETLVVFLLKCLAEILQNKTCFHLLLLW